MQTRIVLLLAALMAVLALAAAPVRADAAAVDVADEVDDTAESELFAEDEAEAEAEDEDELEAEDEGEDQLDAAEEAEDEAEFDAEMEEQDAAAAEDNGVVEAADVSESPEFLEVVPAHALNAKCPKAESCPVCPGVAPVLRERETRFAAKAYRFQHGDDDAVADMTVTDTLQPAFLAGVQFADESVRKAAKAARSEYRHALALMDAHRHYKAVPKGCPVLPAKLDCRCTPFLRLAHLDATKQQALDYAMKARDEDASFWWSMNEAVRDAFLAGVKYNDHERAIRASASEVHPHGASDAEKVQNLQHALDAINAREQAGSTK